MDFFKRNLKPYHKWYWPIVFGCGHFLFFLGGHILALFCFHFWWINYLSAFTWIVFACKNGSDFYMEYFARKYED